VFASRPIRQQHPVMHIEDGGGDDAQPRFLTRLQA
jgi:hypothetical protein